MSSEFPNLRAWLKSGKEGEMRLVFNRLCGTNRSFPPANPVIDRWAIVKRPYGADYVRLMCNNEGRCPISLLKKGGRHLTTIVFRGVHTVGSEPVPLFVTVHGQAGDWSIFRREIIFHQKNVGRKHGPVPSPRREGDSPIFAAVKHFPNTTPLVPRKSGQSPVNGYPCFTRLLCLAISEPVPLIGTLIGTSPPCCGMLVCVFRQALPFLLN
jgi:hypothetical protein